MGDLIWRVAAVVIASGVLASFTDWVFMGVIFHRRYLRWPEVWRREPGKPTTDLIVMSQIIGAVASLAFTLTLIGTGTAGLAGPAFALAVLVWLAGPVVIEWQNALWLKFDGWVAASHAVGWLARLLITAALTLWLLPRQTA